MEENECPLKGERLWSLLEVTKVSKDALEGERDRERREPTERKEGTPTKGRETLKGNEGVLVKENDWGHPRSPSRSLGGDTLKVTNTQNK